MDPKKGRLKVLQDELIALGDKQVRYEVKKVGADQYMIDGDTFKALGLAVSNVGTLFEANDAYGARKVTEEHSIVHGTATGNLGATLSVPTGKMWEVLTIQCSWLMDATVADRTCNFRMPETGLGGVAGSSPSNLLAEPAAMTLSASQFGYITIGNAGNQRAHQCDNGTGATSTYYWGCPFWLNAGGDLVAKIVANGVAGDLSGIDIAYREYIAE